MRREERIEHVRDHLLPWYRAHKRDLPWRRTGDPYAIWISEVMLQQTRVVAAEPYYRRFLQRFPTVKALAKARLDDVLKAWEGMGYYARARNLHKAAQVVVQRHGGHVPRTMAELQALPGVGRYTAGAIASFAFGLPEPILDGNVKRVLVRIFRIREDPRLPAVERKLWDLAARLVPPDDAGDFNQSLIELGAMVCVPRNPRCPQCPVREACLAREKGEQDTLPLRRPAPERPHSIIAVAVVYKRGRVLIGRRPAHALLGGLWEFPGGKVQEGETLEAAAAREVREEIGIEVEILDPIAAVDHAYSHFRITMHAFAARWISGEAKAIGCDEVKWVYPRDLDRYAFPKANRRIIERLRGE